MMNMHRKISLRLDADLADRLQLRADRERVPVSCLLRHLVVRLLDGSEVTEKTAPAPWRSETPQHLKSRAEQLQAEFMVEVCTAFDGFIRQGCDPKEATKRTNFALKARKHPWATYEVVAGVLRKAGRFRKPKRV
ncbi:hypothetical protein GMPD_11600 [Geomonas paludis]|uniref:Uncharacterized protein n=1 Tax=Geomonas paludis TaxID=2740185 RepID=A0A6V8MTD3_9BACT|nr:hypothetical protein GMPD_11600 [Geomonas paludis]